MSTSHLSPVRRTVAALGACGLALALTACGSTSDTAGSGSSDGSSTLTVAASFYPVQYLVEKIGGDAVTVTSVTPANVEPHDFELSPSDVAALGKADLITYVSGFQSSLDEAVAQVEGPTAVDLASAVDLEHHEGVEHEHEEGEEESEEEHASEADPHFWLDPQRMVSAAQAVEASLAKADPDHADTYKANLTSLVSTLEGVDKDYSTGLASCERTTFVTSHAAFAYMAERYGLTQVSISGVDPESEPSPADLAEVKKVVQATGTTTIFTEELVSPKTAEAVAAETGATTAVLSPMESQPEAGDYAAGMGANLEALRTALACK